jgi:tetratricopeptide (TPR) repeat protein
MPDSLEEAVTLVPEIGKDDASNQLRPSADGQAAQTNNDHSAWRRLRSWFSSIEWLFKLVVNAIAVLVIAVLLAVAITWKPRYVIDAISVPKELEERGYTSVAVAQRIIDSIDVMHSAGERAKVYGAFRAPTGPWTFPSDSDLTAAASWIFQFSGRESDQLEISVGGVSLVTTALRLRELLGLKTDSRVVTGEITIDDELPTNVVNRGKQRARTYSLTLRIPMDGDVHYAHEKSDKLDELFRPAALQILGTFDAVNAAYYSYSMNDGESARRFTETYLAKGPVEDKDRAEAEQTLEDKEFARNLRALIAHQEKNYDDAIAQLNDAIETYPSFAPIRYSLSYILIDKGSSVKEKSPDEATGYFEKARDAALDGLKIESLKIDGLEMRTSQTKRELAIGYAAAARALHQLERYDEALDNFGQSAKFDPEFVYAQVMQGWVYRDRIPPNSRNAVVYGDRMPADSRNALAKFQRAAEIHPCLQTYTYWGQFDLDQGQRDEARALFERALKANDTSYASNQIGLLDLAELMWDKAEERFHRAIDHSPSVGEYHRNRGEALRGLGKLADAMGEFEKATELDKEDGMSYAEWGRALAEASRPADGNVPPDKLAEIEKKLTKARRISPDDEQILEIVREAHEILAAGEVTLTFPM